MSETKMCGISGYIGHHRNCGDVLLNGLRRMEYRGYDSAGIALTNGDELKIIKGKGKVNEVFRDVDFSNFSNNGISMGVAHTRWATNGEPSEENAHPHSSCNNEIAIVHNGIIENFRELKKELMSEGHKFRTKDNDSEVIAHLFEENLRKSKTGRSAFQKSLNQLDGHYAIVSAYRNKIYAGRNFAPLTIGIGRDELFVASDPNAFLDYTDQAILLGDKQYAVLGEKDFGVYSLNGKKLHLPSVKIAWEASDLSKGDYDHFTLKEIHEQTSTISTAMMQDSDNLKKFNELLTGGKLYLTGSGTSFNAASLGRRILRRVGIEARHTSISSEFEIDLDQDSVLFAFSQSGETADTLEVVRKAKDNGAKVVSIVNAVGSSMARESDMSLYLNCGPEVGVAATKSFTSQLAILYSLADEYSKNGLSAELSNINKYVRQTMKSESQIKKISQYYSNANDYYFIGRKLHSPIAMEGALKMKEISYIHAEGLAAGELKHGTLALIEKGIPVVVINPTDDTYKETLNSAEEIKTRGGKIIGISNMPNKVYDHYIKIPSVTNEILYPLFEAIPLQMLAYYTTVNKKLDPDYPRNLAKSVTVK